MSASYGFQLRDGLEPIAGFDLFRLAGISRTWIPFGCAVLYFGGGEWDRTTDLRVMSPSL